MSAAEHSVQAQQPSVENGGAFQLEVRPDGIGIITIDVPGERVNTLKAEFGGQVEAILQQVAQSNLEGLVIISGKPDSFIAGADITMLAACTSEQEARTLAQKGQVIFSRLAGLSIPVVAAIHGACLGGGLELALACHRRVCSLDDHTVLGLPEVQLGLLPGSGGTQRLPRLIGASRALDLILTGRHLRARQALKSGLVDDAVPQSILLETAIAMAKQGWHTRPRLPAMERLLSGPLGRSLLFSMVRKKTLAKTHGNYPAAEKIIHVVRQGLEYGSTQGYEEEARAFGELVMTPESAALRSLFFASTALKKERGAQAEPGPLKLAGVLGGGLMGGGIAAITATRAGIPVRIKDISEQGINHALKYCWDLLSKRVAKKRMSNAQRQKQMQLLSGTLDYSGFSHLDIVIEAVFEDLALKQRMVADVEQYAAPRTVFASNTSSLPIHQIAHGARHPEKVIGLHYFSPVDKMPLVEIIPHAGTSEQTIATTVALAQRQGKTAIVVADRAGFYVNRILAPYMSEAARCLLEGEPVETVDRALVKFGFPVGPFALLDEVGIDVGTKILPVLVKELGDRFAAPEAFERLLQDDRKGRKNGRGFYLYGKGKRGKAKKADAGVYRLLNVSPSARMGGEAIVQRCVMLMLNEAARCVEEGVVRNARDGDIGAVFGIGFPPFLGGPLRYIDTLGVSRVVETLRALEQRYGERFAPCGRLLDMQREGRKFHAET